jgi:hypothetical protein
MMEQISFNKERNTVQVNNGIPFTPLEHIKGADGTLFKLNRDKEEYIRVDEQTTTDEGKRMLNLNDKVNACVWQFINGNLCLIEILPAMTFAELDGNHAYNHFCQNLGYIVTFKKRK